jgi:hypothetical protein
MLGVREVFNMLIPFLLWNASRSVYVITPTSREFGQKIVDFDRNP